MFICFLLGLGLVLGSEHGRGTEHRKAPNIVCGAPGLGEHPSPSARSLSALPLGVTDSSLNHLAARHWFLVSLVSVREQLTGYGSAVAREAWCSKPRAAQGRRRQPQRQAQPPAISLRPSPPLRAAPCPGAGLPKAGECVCARTAKSGSICCAELHPCLRKRVQRTESRSN